MTQPGIDQLRNLADRAERHQLTGDEAARLRDGIDALHIRLWNAEDASKAWERKADEQHARAEQAEATLTAITSPESIRAAAIAISDYALTHLGRDLGTIHIEPMAEAGIRAVLDQHGQTPA